MIQQQKQKKERPSKIEDLIGKKVKMTFYRRDATNQSGKKGPADVDEIVEGIVRRFMHRTTAKFAFNGPVSVCGCIETDEGEMRFCFLPLDGPYNYAGYIGNTPSALDGKRNGSYDIEPLGKE